MGIPHNGHRMQSLYLWDTKAEESGVSLANKGNWEKEDDGEKKRSGKNERSEGSKGSDSPIHLDCSDPSSLGH